MRSVCLFFIIVAGCSSSTTPQPAKTPPATPPQGPASSSPAQADKRQKSKAEHDYTGWKEYASAEAAFAVKFPRDPIVKPASQATGKFHVIGVQRQNVEGLGYTCQWTIKERPYANRDAEAAYLKGSQLGALTASKGKLVEEQAIDQEKAQGRDFIIEMPDRSLLRVRSFVAGKRVINLQVSGKDKDAVSSGDALKFFDSLKIGD